MPEIDARLREDVHQLGELLGDTIREQYGPRFLDKIELIRKGAKAARRGSAEGAQQLTATLDGLEEDELLPVARAFNQFLNLANIAEQYHRIRRRRPNEPEPFENLVLEELLGRLKDAGHAPGQLARQLAGLEIELVLTAHPTEVARRTLIQKYDAITAQLAAKDHADLLPEERSRIQQRLQRLVAEAWHTDEIRKVRPTPVDEAKWGFAVIEHSLWQALPNVLRHVDEVLLRSTGERLPLTAALALCLASLALARSGWQLYLLFALLGLLTPGNIPYARILGGWFERRRGAAYGILGLGFGVGGPLALYLGSACIDAFGWRATFLVYGLLEGLLALPLLYALFRERPGDLPQARRPPAGALPGATPGQAWRSADFWLIVGNLILGVFAVTGVMVHGVPLLQERGLSREVATDVLAALWVGMIVSQPALGYLLDRYDTPRIALPFALLAAIGLLLLLLGGPPALLWGAVFLIGLGAGGETGTTQYFVSRYFGLRHFSVIYGSIQPFTFAIAISLGSWLLGYFYDRAGSYAGSTLVLLGAFGVAAGLLVMLGRYRYAIDGEARSHGRD